MMFMFGYWAMGNRQMFSNTLVPKLYMSSPIDPDHGYLPGKNSVEFMILIMLVMLTISYIGLGCLGSTQEEEIYVDEGIGEYFGSINGID